MGELPFLYLRESLPSNKYPSTAIYSSFCLDSAAIRRPKASQLKLGEFFGRGIPTNMPEDPKKGGLRREDRLFFLKLPMGYIIISAIEIAATDTATHRELRFAAIARSSPICAV